MSTIGNLIGGLQVLPRLVLKNQIDRVWAHPKPCSQILMGCLSRLIGLAYGFHLFFIQHGARIASTCRSLAGKYPLSSRLPVHIKHVVRLGSDKQMVGSDTHSIVTVVENAKAFGYRATMKLVGNPVGTTTFAKSINLPVSLSVNRSSVVPAAISLFNVVPKPSY